ncbi:pyridoxamine 5'-phosphate oxidase family protein [Fundidesulfovibrio butyratiphilus]
MNQGLNGPHGRMRRKEREIVDLAEIEAILREGKVMHLALADGNVPFVVPVFYAYDGAAIYFHSARAGAKIAILKRNPLACFEITLDHAVVESGKACDFEARHRTVIGLGRASFVEDTDAKTDVLDMIVAKFTDQKFEYASAEVQRVLVVKINIESIKGKKHGV